jgi:hypothetical protein
MSRETGYIQIDTICPECHKKTTLSVIEDEYKSWKQGTLIQNAFPNLTPEERELLMTGICNNCWETMFDDYED